MSFTEIKEFTEKLRQIGYWKMVSIESFRKPNFTLMADILKYFIRCYEPTSSICKMGIGSCTDRVNFIKAIATYMYTSLGVRLKVGRLYESSSTSIKEASKILNHMLQSLNVSFQISCKKETKTYDKGKFFNLKTDFETSVENAMAEDREACLYEIMTSITKRSEELLRARVLLKEMTGQAASLYSSLSCETTLYKERMRILSKTLDEQEVVECMDACDVRLHEEFETLNNKCQELKEDEGKLTEKLERKVLEMDRCLRRYDALKQIKPVYLDEFQVLEEQLSCLYDNYILTYKQIHYLEKTIEKSPVDLSETELVAPSNPFCLKNEENSLDDEDEEMRSCDNEDCDEFLIIKKASRLPKRGLISGEVPNVLRQHFNLKQTINEDSLNEDDNDEDYCDVEDEEAFGLFDCEYMADSEKHRSIENQRMMNVMMKMIGENHKKLGIDNEDDNDNF